MINSAYRRKIHKQTVSNSTLNSEDGDSLVSFLDKFVFESLLFLLNVLFKF